MNSYWTCCMKVRRPLLRLDGETRLSRAAPNGWPEFARGTAQMRPRARLLALVVVGRPAGLCTMCKIRRRTSSPVRWLTAVRFPSHWPCVGWPTLAMPTQTRESASRTPGRKAARASAPHSPPAVSCARTGLESVARRAGQRRASFFRVSRG